MLFAISCVISSSTADVSFLPSRTFPKNFSQTDNIRWQRKGLAQKTESPGSF